MSTSGSGDREGPRRGVVQIIHAKICFLVSDDPQRDSQNMFHHRRRMSEDIYMCSRFRDDHLFQSTIPFIFRDDGFWSRLERRDADESTEVERIGINEP